MNCRGIAAVASWILFAIPVFAQCEIGWRQLIGGVQGEVLATAMWDPDGNGPQAARLVVAGGFRDAVGIPDVNGVVLFDPTNNEWTPLSGGTNGVIWALAQLPDGDLVAGGRFSSAGGVAANNVARWDGTSWSSLDAGVVTSCSICVPVSAMVVLPNGDLVVGGAFDTAGDIEAAHVARWNGNAWSAMGSGFPGQYDLGVYALAARPDGDVIAGGALWVPVGTGERNALVRWDGSSWNSVSPGLLYTVHSLTSGPGGAVYAGGNFASATVSRFGRVTSTSSGQGGTTWELVQVGPTNGVTSIEAIAVLANGDVVVGGIFNSIGGTQARNIARWNGAEWVPLGAGVDGPVSTLLVMPDGTLAVGGNIQLAGGLTVRNLAIYSFEENPNDPGCNGCGACAADYDQDGGVTGADLAAFFVDYEAGAACADVDDDGGVTGGDLGAFFAAYEAGGC